MKKLILVLFGLVLFSVGVVAVECGSIPTDGCEVTVDTTFDPGTYNLPNGITIGADGVTLDCNGAELVGDMGPVVTYGIRIFSSDNVVKNCIIDNYHGGIDNRLAGTNNKIMDNVILGSHWGILGGNFEVIRNFIDYVGISAIHIDSNANITENIINTSNAVPSVANAFYVRGVNNNIWNNDFYGGSITCNDYKPCIYDENPENNTYCIDCVGNNYYDGAIGPTCPLSCSDSDGDGFTVDVDCDDNDASVHPPSDGMVITQDTTFCPGTYNLPNGITIGASAVTLDCNGAELVGDYTPSSMAIRISRVSSTVENCVINKYYYGVHSTLSNNVIKNNYIDSIVNDAIHFQHTNNNIITGNTITNATWGIWITVSSNNITVADNTISNSRYGIFFSGVDESNILNNDISNNLIPTYLVVTSNNVIKGNMIHDNPGTGIYVSMSSNNIFEENQVNNNIVGITIDRDNEYNIVNNNIFSNNEYGIHLIYMTPSDPPTNNYISNNKVINNTDYGIFIYRAYGNTIWNNIFSNDVNAFSNNWNNWNSSSIGNCWSDFESNVGYPTHYVIDSEGIDYHPCGAYDPDEDGDGVPNDEDKCPGTEEEALIYGCSCNQILDLKPGEDTAENRDGCSEGILKIFEEAKGWAKGLFVEG